jgi:hypothetical protein
VNLSLRSALNKEEKTQSKLHFSKTAGPVFMHRNESCAVMFRRFLNSTVINSFAVRLLSGRTTATQVKGHWTTNRLTNPVIRRSLLRFHQAPVFRWLPIHRRPLPTPDGERLKSGCRCDLRTYRRTLVVRAKCKKRGPPVQRPPAFDGIAAPPLTQQSRLAKCRTS